MKRRRVSRLLLILAVTTAMIAATAVVASAATINKNDADYKYSKTFDDGTVVTPALLKEKGIIKKQLKGIKVLGNGKLEKKLTIQAHKFSASALEKIKESGSKAEVI